MSFLSRCCLAALLSCALPSNVLAAERTPPPRDVLHGAPLHLVVLNERVRMQVPYVGPAGVPQVVSNTIPAGTLLAGNLIGGLVVAGIERQRLKEARETIQPAYDLLRTESCLLDGSSVFMDALQPVAQGEAQPVVARQVLAAGKTVDDVVSAEDERHMLLISYALTPDLEYLLTTVQVMYAPQGEGKKASGVSWDGQVTVASPAAPLADKTPEDMDRLVKETNARWAASGGDALVDAANRGDRSARREVATRYRAHQDLLKQARSPEWSLPHAAIERARTWVAEDCAALHRAVQANADAAASLLPRLYAQDLQAFPKPGFWKLPPITEETRNGLTIRASGPAAWLAWPEGLPVPGRHPSSAWMPDDEAGAAGDAGERGASSP